MSTLSLEDCTPGKVLKNLKKHISQIPPLTIPYRCWALSNEEKANIFRKHLAQVFILFPSNDINFVIEIEEHLNLPWQLFLPVKPSTLNNKQYTTACLLFPTLEICRNNYNCQVWKTSTRIHIILTNKPIKIIWTPAVIQNQRCNTSRGDDSPQQFGFCEGHYTIQNSLSHQGNHQRENAACVSLLGYPTSL